LCKNNLVQNLVISIENCIFAARKMVRIMSAAEFDAIQKMIRKTQKLWKPIIEEERMAIENQPELSESEWLEIRASHAVA
jgi:hypothetical protein